MLLYCSPGGTWAGSEKDYKAALKREGVDPKSVDRKQVEVPVAKPALMEFLTFHQVNPINPRASQVSAGVPTPPLPVAPAATPAPPLPEALTGVTQEVSDIEEGLAALPLTEQLRLAHFIINRAKAALTT